MKKISILASRQEFGSEAVKLELAGEATFLPSEAKTLKDYIKVSKEAEILAYDPSRVGKDRALWLHEIIKSSPNIKALALNTTTYEYVDPVQVAERGIRIITVPETSTESVAEHVLMLLLACSKRLLINEARTFKRKYVPELGVELKGKTLGILGMGAVGERLAELVQPLHMRYADLLLGRTTCEMGRS
jgi:lactate dehydrogenase-like 2-hydroxyacid dehydrogenase